MKSPRMIKILLTVVGESIVAGESRQTALSLKSDKATLTVSCDLDQDSKVLISFTPRVVACGQHRKHKLRVRVR